MSINVVSLYYDRGRAFEGIGGQEKVQADYGREKSPRTDRARAAGTAKYVPRIEPMRSFLPLPSGSKQMTGALSALKKNLLSNVT